MVTFTEEILNGKLHFLCSVIEYFYSQNHHGTHGDIIVQIIDHCDPKGQEKRENIWIHKLKTLYPDGLNQKRII